MVVFGLGQFQEKGTQSPSAEMGWIHDWTTHIGLATSHSLAILDPATQAERKRQQYPTTRNWRSFPAPGVPCTATATLRGPHHFTRGSLCAGTRD
ncbi:hypothetical protein CRG98_027618 [Punica granatum]|uniref:Uncharacterized protein n=1 Tax=Punica granatum TaxID=22663 RepID=A0A2I0J8D8_PUNGR|nr:hypothetical protein CRG98_027618 [Punica granatum]